MPDGRVEAAVAVLAAHALAATPGAGRAAEPWTVTGTLLGGPSKADPAVAKPSKDVSGVVCDGGSPQLCLVVDDEGQGTQVVVLRDREIVAGDFIRLIEDVFGATPIELDAEAAAYADGAFYIVGSHGRPRRKTDMTDAERRIRSDACSRVFRIRFAADAVDRRTARITKDPSIEQSIVLGGLIGGQPLLAEWQDRPLQENGVTIEGASVRGQMFYAGFRGPVLAGGDAVILEVPLATLFEAPSAGAAPAAPATLHRVALGTDSAGGPRGVRDLVAVGDRWLILAGPVNDPPDGDAIARGDYAIYWWTPTGSGKVQDLGPFPEKVKPEGLLALAQTGDTLRALLVFDGPGQGQPVEIEVALPH